MSGSIFGSSSFGGTFSADNFYDAQKLIDSVLRASSQALTDTEARARVLTYLNARYLQVLKSKHWSFLEGQVFIDLLEPHDTGLISSTQGSQALVGNGSAFNATMVGQKILLGTDKQAYPINTVGSSTTMSIFNKYTEASQADVNFEVLFYRYQLPQNIQNIRGVVLNGVHKMVPIGPQEMHLHNQDQPGLTGTPRWYTITGMESDSGQFTMEVYPVPDQRYAVSIDYTIRPTPLEDVVDCFPLIPDWHLDVLYYGCLADTYRYLENDSGYASSKQDYLQSYTRMISDTQLTDSVVQISPARNYFNRIRSRGRGRGFFGLKWFGKVDD